MASSAAGSGSNALDELGNVSKVLLRRELPGASTCTCVEIMADFVTSGGSAFSPRACAASCDTSMRAWLLVIVSTTPCTTESAAGLLTAALVAMAESADVIVCAVALLVVFDTVALATDASTSSAAFWVLLSSCTVAFTTANTSDAVRSACTADSVTFTELALRLDKMAPCNTAASAALAVLSCVVTAATAEEMLAMALRFTAGMLGSSTVAAATATPVHPDRPLL